MEAVKGLSDRFLELVGRNMFVRLTAFYALIVGLFGVCVAPLFAVLSGLTILGLAVGEAADTQMGAARNLDPQLGAEMDAALSGLTGASALAGGMAVLALVAGLGLLIVSVGLFRRANWGRTGFILIGGIDLVISLLLLITGFDLMQLLSVLITGFVIFIFVTDAEVKQLFTGKQAFAG